jgi:hypothetical protein
MLLPELRITKAASSHYELVTKRQALHCMKPKTRTMHIQSSC